MAIFKKKSKSGNARDFSIKSRNSLTSGSRQRDSVFQQNDIGRNTVRSSRRQATWIELHAKPVAFGVGLVVGWLISLIIVTGIAAVLARWLSAIAVNNNLHYFDAWFTSVRSHGSIFEGSLIYFATRTWLLIPAVLMGVLAMISFGKQAAKTVAKLDDSAMQTDVNDAWIWSVGEMIEQYAVIADLGMHSTSTAVSSIVGHIYLKNKGLKHINMAKHDETGSIMYDEDGNVLREKVPLIDNTDIRKTLDMQGLTELDLKSMLIDATKYPYDKKDGRIRTLADAINEDWYMPDYEFLRPMGAYFVETNSVHTLILSMTRGNKTQLATLSTVDAWRRDNTLWNLVTNDPKGEMMMASYQLLQRAGYDVVPFSLTHEDKSVRYNPLQMVIEDVRRGRMPAASTELSNLSSTFFPSSGGDDFWISTARSVFQMMTYQLMNYMVDEERRAIRMYQAYKSGSKLVDQLETLGNKRRPELHTQSQLDRYIDDLWGNVSMNSMYQMISQLDIMHMSDGIVAASDTKYNWDPNDEDAEKPEEVTGLDIMASAMRELPDNAIRRNFKGPDTMIRKASGSDATTGSIYATALNNMNFFVQETIKKLTTVSPKNGLNILDFPFPRRFSVRLDPLVMSRLHLARRRFKAVLYKDPFFTKPYGNKKHDTIDDGAVESSGWIDFWFQKIPRPKTGQFYIQIDIYDGSEENIVVTLRFAIDKGFLLSEDGNHYILDPITHKPIVKDGTAFEVKPMKKSEALALKNAGKAIKMSQRRNSYVSTKRVRALKTKSSTNPGREVVEQPVVAQTMFNYTEKPKALFLSIPPQIESQAKLALVLIDSIFNTSMGKGYEVRGDTQKPDYGTRYMLEELGNLKSDGAGIQGFDSKLSIGLSANQQMTMVFQGMRQISSVYGEDMRYITADNVGTIHYMLSTQSETLEYVSGLTGKTHRIDIASQSISEAVGTMDGGDNTINTTKSKVEVPVISTDQLAHLTDGETVVITPTRRRDKMGRVTRTNPVFNTKEQLLPFAYAVLSKQTKATEASGQGTAETASTIYSTVDSHPDQMVPDFEQVLRVMVRQAMYYVRHRDALREQFMDPVTTPYGSEALSDAIMDYITYGVDINKVLIEDGLAPYMMLTKDEIKKAYADQTYSLDRGLAASLLTKLGYDPDVELTSSDINAAERAESALMTFGPEQDVDYDDFETSEDRDMYLTTDSSAGLTAEEFDERFKQIGSDANNGDKDAALFLNMLVNKSTWSLAPDTWEFDVKENKVSLIDESKTPIIRIGRGSVTSIITEPSEEFRLMFSDSKGETVFSDMKTYNNMLALFNR